MMLDISPTRSPTAFNISNIQSGEQEHDTEIDTSGRQQDPRPDPIVIDLTGSEYEDNQNKEDKKLISGSQDLAPGPSTGKKSSAPPVMFSPCDPSSNGRGNDQRPAAQAGSSPVPTPVITTLRIVAQHAPVPECQLTSTTTLPIQGVADGSGVDAARRVQEEATAQQDANFEALQQKYNEIIGKNKSLEEQVKEAQNSSKEKEMRVQELILAVAEAAKYTSELQEKLENALKQIDKAEDRADALEKQLGDAEAQARQNEETFNKYKEILGNAQSNLTAEKTVRKDAEARADEAERQRTLLAEQFEAAAAQACQREDGIKKQLADNESKLQAEITGRKDAEDRAVKAQNWGATVYVRGQEFYTKWQGEMASRKKAEDRAAKADQALKSAVSKSQSKDNTIAKLTQDLNQAIKEAETATKSAAEFQRNWFLAEERIGAANAVTLEAQRKEEKASNLLKCVQSKLGVEVNLKEDAKKRASKAEANVETAGKKIAEWQKRASEAGLAVKETAAEATTAITQKIAELEQARADTELVKKQAAAKERAMAKNLAAALESAAEAKQAAEASHQQELAAKNTQIQSLTESDNRTQIRISQLEIDNRRLKRTLNNQEDDLKVQKGEIEDLDKKMEKIEKLETELKEKDERIKKLERDSKILNDEIDRMRSRAYRAEDDLKAYKDKDRKKETTRHRDDTDRKRPRDSDHDYNSNKRNKNSVDLRQTLQHNNGYNGSSRRGGSSSRSPPASERPIERKREDYQPVQQTAVPSVLPRDPRPQPQKVRNQAKQDESKEDGEYPSKKHQTSDE